MQNVQQNHYRRCADFEKFVTQKTAKYYRHNFFKVVWVVQPLIICHTIHSKLCAIYT